MIKITSRKKHGVKRPKRSIETSNIWKVSNRARGPLHMVIHSTSFNATSSTSHHSYYPCPLLSTCLYFTSLFSLPTSPRRSLPLTIAPPPPQWLQWRVARSCRSRRRWATSALFTGELASAHSSHVPSTWPWARRSALFPLQRRFRIVTPQQKYSQPRMRSLRSGASRTSCERRYTVWCYAVSPSSASPPRAASSFSMLRMPCGRICSLSLQCAGKCRAKQRHW